MSGTAPMAEQRIDVWLDALASGSATPGGGAFAALSAAAGTSLVAMVCRLTIGKERFAEVETRMSAIVAECDEERLGFLRLADEDAAAFDRVMAAYRMPRETGEDKAARLRHLQEGLEGAAEVPLMVARRAVYVMGLAGEATSIGNPNAASDGLSGAGALFGGALAALSNVRINAFAFTDATRREELLDDCRRLRDRADALLAEAEEAFAAATS
ncbi:MAG TPA: cyclodeaminase/cyclohydrolase family protein [Actinomycetota bacterium]|nr:cyclodeaminase/cyclohydrolase family protein [Actinomycetota bacterium]